MVSILPFYSPVRPVQKSSKSVSLPDILSSLSPTSLSERLTALRRDIIHFIEFVLTQPLSTAQVRDTDPLSASIEHRLELFPAPPNSTPLISRLDNLSGILEFLHTQLFGAIPSSQRAAFLKSFSKPLTSGVLNHLLIPALPTSLSGLPKYLELLERAVKFENEDLTRILFGPTSGASTGTEIRPENEIKSWVGGIVSHYQKERRVNILGQARRMFLDVSSDWYDTFQVEWPSAPATPALGVDGFALPELDPGSHLAPVVDHPPAPITHGANGGNRGVEVGQVDDEGWGFDEDDNGAGEEGAPPHEEGKGPQRNKAQSSFAEQDTHTGGEVDNDAWGWDDDEGPQPTPVPEPEENGNGNAEDGVGRDDPLWVSWDDAPPSPPTKRVVPKPATKLEKLSSKGKQRANAPKIVTQSPGPEPIPVPPKAPALTNPNHLPAPISSLSLSSSWSSSSSPTSQQFQSIPPTPASITTRKKVPKEFYTVSSGMQDILELVESVLLESSEFSRSTLLSAYLPAPNSASSAPGGMPGSVILSTLPSILDLFRALYPMTLQLELESGGRFQKGTGKGAATEVSAKKAIQFSNDCLYLEEQIQELLVALPGSSKSHTIPPDIWTIDDGLRSKVEDAGTRVRVYGKSWFVKTIVRHLSPPPSVYPSFSIWCSSLGETTERG